MFNFCLSIKALRFKCKPTETWSNRKKSSRLEKATNKGGKEDSPSQQKGSISIASFASSKPFSFPAILSRAYLPSSPAFQLRKSRICLALLLSLSILFPLFSITHKEIFGHKSVEDPSAGSIARMYPKVKVKVQNSVDQEEDDLGLSWSEISSPDEYQADSPKCVIRVPTAQILKQLRHPTPDPIVDHKGKKSEEADISSTIARSISVPRPRAVLSSPDNDNMIGSKNSKRVIQPSPLQNHNIAQNRHEPSCKVIPTQTPTESPISTRRKPTSALKDHTPSSTNSRRIIKGKPKAVRDQTPTKVKQSSIVSSQKAHLKTERPNSGTVRPGTSVVPGHRACLKTV